MSLKEEIISSIKEAREMAFRLGDKNVTSALKNNSKSFMGTLIACNTQFFDRTQIDTEKHELTQGGKTYSTKFVDGKLPDATIDFFSNGLVGYYYYRALVQNCEPFYKIYENAINENPNLDIVTLVDDAIAMEGEHSTSIKLDLTYLKNNSIGTLNQTAVGFENALYHIFGAYRENDPEIKTFIEQIKGSFTEESQQKAIEGIIKVALERADTRANACHNIDKGCEALIKFSGITNTEDYHKALDQHVAEQEKELGISSLILKNQALRTKDQTLPQTISQYKTLLNEQRSADVITAELTASHNERVRLIDANKHLVEEKNELERILNPKDNKHRQRAHEIIKLTQQLDHLKNNDSPKDSGQAYFLRKLEETGQVEDLTPTQLQQRQDLIDGLARVNQEIERLEGELKKISFESVERRIREIDGQQTQNDTKYSNLANAQRALVQELVITTKQAGHDILEKNDDGTYKIFDGLGLSKEAQDELSKHLNPLAVENLDFPIKDADGNIVQASQEVDVYDENGNKIGVRQVTNIAGLSAEITSLEASLPQIKDAIISTDAELVASYSMMLYATNFDALGGAIVSALDTLNTLAYNPGDYTQNNGDIRYNTEQIKQALSIANNLHILNLQESGTKYLTQITQDIQQKIYDVYAKYPTKVDSKTLQDKISQICRDEKYFYTTDKDGNVITNPNPFFGREQEIMQQTFDSLSKVDARERAKNYNHRDYIMAHLDPRLLNEKFNAAMSKWYKDHKLIPVTKIKIGRVSYDLQEEYKPHTTFEKQTVQPPPLELKETSYCAEIKKALDRELEALSGAKTKGDSRSADVKDLEFNNSYRETLTQVRNEFANLAKLGPKAFEDRQRELMDKYNDPAKRGLLTQQEILMLRYLPEFNPALAEYQEQIKNAKTQEEIDSLRVGKYAGRNSIFPDQLNIGLKLAVLSSEKSAPSLQVKMAGIFDSGKTSEEFGQFNEALKEMLDSPYRDFLTIEIKDGTITVTNDLYEAKDGKLYSTNTYDKSNLHETTPVGGHHLSTLMKNEPNAQVYFLKDGELQKYSLEDFEKESGAKTGLVQVSPGAYALRDQVTEINKAAVNEAEKKFSKEGAIKQWLQANGVTALEPTSSNYTPQEMETPAVVQQEEVVNFGGDGK